MKNTQIDNIWQYIVDADIATDDTLRVITSINGYNIDTLNDVLYAVTGYRDIKQLKENEQ
jgi:hypothetical protein